MALDKPGLVTALTAIFSDLSGRTPAQKADDVATAIDAFVRTGTVTTNVVVDGVTLVTVGSDPSGPGTGTGTGTIA